MGPALSCFDVDLSAASRPNAATKKGSEAKRMAQQHATAQEARSMLGVVTVPRFRARNRAHLGLHLSAATFSCLIRYPVMVIRRLLSAAELWRQAHSSASAALYYSSSQLCIRRAQI